MITKQKENQETEHKVFENADTSMDLNLPSIEGVPAFSIPDCNNEQAAIIVQQFSYRDIKAVFVKEIAATRTTTYFFELDEHRLNDIVRIDSTMRRILEIALETSGISILAPVPETSQIAVIVPKKECEPVRLSSFVDEIKKFNHKIPCVLGEDHLGNPRVIDLVECHHQLIAGATGSGKSNSLKAIITAIAMICDNKLLKLLIVDGKGIDLVAFNRLPHLLCPVITERKKAINALKWLSQEMERRRSFLQTQNIPDIWTYNEQCSSESEDEIKDSSNLMSAILLIVDEVQVLMNGKNDVAESLLRTLTQQGRAVGIILVLSTQRPSVDIIQGSIKINLPGRIAFNLPSQVDSRVILDQPGAELLKSKGDMLVNEAPFGKVMRLQAPLVTDKQIEEVCNSFKCQEEDSHNVDTEIVGNPTLTKHIMPGNIENIGQDCSFSKSAEGVSLDTEIYKVPASKFVKVLVKYRNITAWITKKYADRSWHIELVYYPFLYGHVRENFRKFKILYSVRTGRFIKSLVPLDTVEIGHNFEDLNDEFEIFASLRDTASQVTQIKDIIISNDKNPAVKDAYIAKLVERGLIGVAPEGYFIQRDFRSTPRLSGKLCLVDVPEIPSRQLTGSCCPAREIAEQLRLQLWKIWQATLEKYVYIGLPTYRAVSTQDDTLMFPACSPIWKLKINHFFSHLERFHFNANIETSKDDENEI